MCQNVIIKDKCEPELEGYKIVDIKILCDIIASQTSCHQCHSKSLTLTDDGKDGLVSRLILKCSSESCDFAYKFYTSACVNKQVHDDNEKTDTKTGKASFDLNMRMVMGFRDIGKGITAIEKFCAALNMPPPMVN